MKRPFLTARWSNLVLVTYAVDPQVLSPWMPPGCEADTREGRAFVSLVAFDFLGTRVLGVRWPGFVDFPEINLRFYVKKDGRRGVSFVRELVPSRLVAGVARVLYNEPYRRAAMLSRVADGGATRTIEHEIAWKGRRHRLRAEGGLPAFLPGPETVEHFFKEHEIGYGRTRRGRLLTYRVEHPAWEVLRDARATLDWGFADVYGDAWAFLDGAAPFSVVVALGSAVSVSPFSSP